MNMIKLRNHIFFIICILLVNNIIANNDVKIKLYGIEYKLPKVQNYNTSLQWEDLRDNINSVLIDFISDQVPSQNPSCPSGWDAYPTQANREGFYACVTDEAIASIYLEGEKDRADDVVIVESKVFARLAE